MYKRKLTSQLLTLKLFSPEQKFVYMLTSETLKVIKLVASFLKNAREIRSGTNTDLILSGHRSLPIPSLTIRFAVL